MMAAPTLSRISCGGQDNNVVAFVGDDGTLPLVSVDSRQCVGTLRMNGTGRYLTAGGGDGVVCVWDMRHQRRCVRAFRDEGSLGVTSVGASAGGLLAVGSWSGIVTVYRDVWKKAAIAGVGVVSPRSQVSPRVGGYVAAVKSCVFMYDVTLCKSPGIDREGDERTRGREDTIVETAATDQAMSTKAAAKTALAPVENETAALVEVGKDESLTFTPETVTRQALPSSHEQTPLARVAIAERHE